MKIASVADIKAHFSAYLKSAARGPVIVTRNGKPVGVLLATEDEEELERLVLAYSPRLRTLLHAARQRIRAGSAISHEDLWRGVDSHGETRPQRGAKRKMA
jgi:prevent-host-death family protein